MFTLEQIKAAHSKVKSGADFPQYIQDIIRLGVTKYVTYVEDGRVDFQGTDSYYMSVPPKYSNQIISQHCDIVKFKKDLKEHQEGATDYLTFCAICANLGIKKWEVSTKEMTCTYYDIQDNEIILEKIPDLL